MRILIIEDDSDLAANIYDFVESKGHEADAAGDGITGLHLAITHDYDVIIMDINMPGMDGLTACSKLRQDACKQTPVLMLTARDTLDDKLAGFDSGADDYLVKPFALQELMARLNALSLRGHPRERAQKPLQIADLVFNPSTLEVRRAGHTIPLTPTGLKLLHLLMRHSPNVVTRQEIEQELWHDSPPDSDSLRAHMHTLRSAIDRPFGTALIQTIHGIGFKLAPPSGADDEV